MNRSSAFRSAIAGLMLCLAAAVQAAPIVLINATDDGKPPLADLSNVPFYFTYEDSDGDGAFALSELLTFVWQHFSSADPYYNLLLALPDIPGVVGTGGGVWKFGLADGNGDVIDTLIAPADRFSLYDEFGQAVPEPGSLALGLTCLAALGFARRHARQPNAAAAHLQTSG